MLAVASGVSIVANYVFLLAAGRILGSEQYGSLAALLGRARGRPDPGERLQMAVSREVSRTHRVGRHRAGPRVRASGACAARAIATRAARRAALALALRSHGPAQHRLGRHRRPRGGDASSPRSSPRRDGRAAGKPALPRARRALLVPFVVRLVILAIAAAAGYRLGGAVVATCVERDRRHGARARPDPCALEPTSRRPPSCAPFLRYLGPVAIGLIGIALLTHVDLLIVKARFPATTPARTPRRRRSRASASSCRRRSSPSCSLARPRDRRGARRRRTSSAGRCSRRQRSAARLALVYCRDGRRSRLDDLRSGFRRGRRQCWRRSRSRSASSPLANILVGYHLSRGETRYAWIVAAGVLVQVTVLSLIPSTLARRRLVERRDRRRAARGARGPRRLEPSRRIRAGARHFAGGAGAACAGLPEGRSRPGRHDGVRLRRSSGRSSRTSARPSSACPARTRPAASRGSGALQHESGYHLLGTIAPHAHRRAVRLGRGRTRINLQWLAAVLPGVPRDAGRRRSRRLQPRDRCRATCSPAWRCTLSSRYLGCAPLVSAWAALVYVVFPWHLARAEHASLVHIEVLALLVLALVAVARSPSLLRFGFVGVANLACWLTSGYYGAMAAITTRRLRARRRPRSRAAGAGLCSSRARRRARSSQSVSSASRLSSRARTPAQVSAARPATSPSRAPAARAGRARRRRISSSATGSTRSGRHTCTGRTPPRSRTTSVCSRLHWPLRWLVTAIRRRKALSEDTRGDAGLMTAFVVGFLFAVPSPVLSSVTRSGRRRACSGRSCRRSGCLRAGIRCS